MPRFYLPVPPPRDFFVCKRHGLTYLGVSVVLYKYVFGERSGELRAASEEMGGGNGILNFDVGF